MYKRRILYRHNAKPLACFEMETVDCKWQTNQITDVNYSLIGGSKFVTASMQNHIMSPKNDLFSTFKDEQPNKKK